MLSRYYYTFSRRTILVAPLRFSNLLDRYKRRRALYLNSLRILYIFPFFKVLTILKVSRSRIPRLTITDRRRRALKI